MIELKTNNPYPAFEDAFLRAVRKGLAQAVPELRPWNDERPTAMASRKTDGMLPITAEDVRRAVAYLQEPIDRGKIDPFQCAGYYILTTEWAAPWVSEADCIAYYADNGSVLVYDSQGRFWRRGQQTTMAELFEVKKVVPDG